MIFCRFLRLRDLSLLNELNVCVSTQTFSSLKEAHKDLSNFLKLLAEDGDPFLFKQRLLLFKQETSMFLLSIKKIPLLPQ